MLREYKVGQVFTFCPMRELDDVPEELQLWHYDDEVDDDGPDDDVLDDDVSDDDEHDRESLYGHA
jgi:hypothetical protein